MVLGCQVCPITPEVINMEKDVHRGGPCTRSQNCIDFTSHLESRKRSLLQACVRDAAKPLNTCERSKLPTFQASFTCRRGNPGI